MIPDTTARVMLAVLDGATTTRSVQQHTGIRSTATVYRHLKQLQTHGLVDWQAGLTATLHPTCRPVTTKARPHPARGPVADGPSAP